MAGPFDAIRSELRRQVPDIVQKVATDLAQDIRDAAPEQDGNLKRSIELTSAGDRHTVTAHDEAAAHVEFGTVNMAAQPFFMPAVRQARKRLRRDLAKAIDAAGGSR